MAIGTRRYSDPGRLVAGRLGIESVHTVYSTHGGQTPQALISRAACDIWEGRFRTVAIGGAESWRTRQRLKKAGVTPDWTVQDPEDHPDEVFGAPLRMGSKLENSLGFGDPLDAYPLFETAIRHAAGRSPAEHAEHVARLWQDFNVVARTNPFAAISEPITSTMMKTVNPENRLISHPYPKLEVANNSVDQAAAVLLTSVGEARRQGISPDEWVFLHGSGEANDTDSVTARASLHSSQPIRAAATAALAEAGIVMDDVALLDVYSCFPSAVQIGAEALGIGLDRPLTVTGGLTFAGGPWNNYVTHAVATMVEQLRGRPGDFGLCTANGGLLTKHAVGVYSTRPPERMIASPVTRTDFGSREVVPDHAGTARVAGYTVRYATDGEKTHGFAVCEIPGGQRLLARFDDPDLLDWFTENEGVGRTVEVSGTTLRSVEPVSK